MAWHTVQILTASGDDDGGDNKDTKQVNTHARNTNTHIPIQKPSKSLNSKWITKQNKTKKEEEEEEHCLEAVQGHLQKLVVWAKPPTQKHCETAWPLGEEWQLASHYLLRLQRSLTLHWSKLTFSPVIMSSCTVHWKMTWFDSFSTCLPGIPSILVTEKSFVWKSEVSLR